MAGDDSRVNSARYLASSSSDVRDLAPRLRQPQAGVAVGRPAAARAGSARARARSAAAGRRRGGCAPVAAAPSARPRSREARSTHLLRAVPSARRASGRSRSRFPAAALTASSSSGLVCERRVVDERRHMLPLPVDHRHRSGRRRRRAAPPADRRGRTSFELREPVRQGQRRIAQSAREPHEAQSVTDPRGARRRGRRPSSGRDGSGRCPPGRREGSRYRPRAPPISPSGTRSGTCRDRQARSPEECRPSRRA